MILRLLRSLLTLPIMPVPPGMRPATPSDFSLLGLAQNTNVYAEGVTTIVTAGTNVTLTPAQVLAKNLVLTAGASGSYTLTLPSTSTIIDALGPTMPLDGSFYFTFEVWNKATLQTATLTAGDSNTTLASADNTIPTDTFGKWMIQVNPIVSSALGRPTTLTITRVAAGLSTGNAGTGTVTSVNATVPTEFTVSGVPFTTAGTIAIGKATETANTVWAGPTSGGVAQPTFRALVIADMPGGFGTGTVTSVALTMPAEFSVGGSPVTTSGTLAVTKATESANTVWAGPTSGAAAAPTFRQLGQQELAPAGWFAMTDGATITPNCANGPKQKVTLGGNRTLAAPTNIPGDGFELWLRFTQDGTGSRTITPNAIYLFANGSKTLSTAANAVDLYACVYDSGTATFYCQLSPNFS